MLNAVGLVLRSVIFIVVIELVCKTGNLANTVLQRCSFSFAVSSLWLGSARSFLSFEPNAWLRKTNICLWLSTARANFKNYPKTTNLKKGIERVSILRVVLRLWMD